MLKNTHIVLLLMVLIASSGCQTVSGAANGMGQDIRNIPDPAQNGWNALQKADAWIQQNLW